MEPHRARSRQGTESALLPGLGIPIHKATHPPVYLVGGVHKTHILPETRVSATMFATVLLVSLSRVAGSLCGVCDGWKGVPATKRSAPGTKSRVCGTFGQERQPACAATDLRPGPAKVSVVPAVDMSAEGLGELCGVPGPDEPDDPARSALFRCPHVCAPHLLPSAAPTSSRLCRWMTSRLTARWSVARWKWQARQSWSRPQTGRCARSRMLVSAWVTTTCQCGKLLSTAAVQTACCATIPAKGCTGLAKGARGWHSKASASCTACRLPTKSTSAAAPPPSPSSSWTAVCRSWTAGRWVPAQARLPGLANTCVPRHGKTWARPAACPASIPWQAWPALAHTTSAGHRAHPPARARRRVAPGAHHCLHNRGCVSRVGGAAALLGLRHDGGHGG